MLYYTYIYYDPLRNNIPIYVGKGKEERVWAHLKLIGPNSKFMNRLKTLAKNNIMPNIGIYSYLDEEFAFFLEQELISKFGRRDLNTGTLYNLTPGGEAPPIQKKRGIGNGRPLSEETKQKNRDARAKQTNLAYGKRSEESKQKMSIAHIGITAWNKGISPTEETKEKIRNKILGKKFEKVECEVCKKMIATNNIKNHIRKHS